VFDEIELTGMRLYLIRHGQSVNNFLWSETGSDKGRAFDPELTPIGQAQAERVAAFLRDELNARLPLNGLDNDAARPQLLYTSLMTRAVQTGRVIARALNVPLVALSDAHETGGLFLQDEASGERRGMEGPNRAHFEKHFPEFTLPDHLNERGWWDLPLEEDAQRPERAGRVWQALLARHGDGEEVIGLITHGGFYNYLLAHLLQLVEKEKIWFTLNNCAVSRIDVNEYGVALVYLNRFDFLPPGLIT
jgi:2,3-bisphosphoglycerate-dependent phosphoglycerate mutase